MKQTPTRFLASLLLVALAGCAVSPERCDPKVVNNVFQSHLCDAAFQQRIADLEARIATVRAEHRVTEAESAALRREARALANDRQKLRMDMDRTQLQLAAQTAELNRLRADTTARRKVITAMRQKLSEAKQALAQLDDGERASAQRIAQLKAEIQAKQDTYIALTKLYRQVE